MAIKEILTIPDEILNTKAAKVTNVADPEIVELINDLKDTLEDAKDPEGAGLAATQVGASKRICVVRDFIPIESADATEFVTDEYVLVNPKIVSRSEELELDFEGCLSVPNQYGQVERHKKIKVKAINENGDPIRLTASGFFARTIQHEIDHLDGILFIEKVIGNTISEEELEQRTQGEK